MLRKLTPWWPLALAVLAILARLLPGERIIDDAFITFRYARNLLEGHGFAYNAGEPVLGTTTPLFTLLLAGLALPWGGAQANFPQIAVVVSALADSLSCVLLYQLGRKLGSPAAGLASALAWAVAPFSVTFAIGGLETSVYVLLLLSLMWAFLNARIVLAAGLGAAAILTRPDAVLLVGLVLAWHGLCSRPHILQAGFWRHNAKAIATFLLPLLAWALWAGLYFGSPLAQSVSAKSNAYRVEPLAMLSHMVNHFATPFMEHLSFGANWLYVGLWLYPFLFIIGAMASYRRQASSLPFALFPWVHFIVFSIGNPLVFRWYLTPPLPFYFLFVALGASQLVAAALRPAPTQRRSAGRAALAALLVLLPMLSLLRGWVRLPEQPPARPAPSISWIQLERLYEEAAGLLQAHAASRAQPITLAAADVGVLGYRLPEMRILDLVGLNSKETLPYYPLDAAYYGDFLYAVPPDLVMDELPDYVAILEIYGRYGLLSDPRFQARYELLRFLPSDLYGSGGLAVYALRP